MKKLILLITVLGIVAAKAFAAGMCPATGRVVDQQGAAVEYATVVLLKGTQQVAGMASDTRGRFELKVPAGEYTLSIQYLGFEPIRRLVRVEAQNDLGDIVLQGSATQIEGVVVKAQLVRREADRFVVDVANTPASLGKDGIELLERAPGVWIDGEKITINGKSGSKVFVNDRELRMEPEQLLNYLRTLRAEEIQTIEVIPTVGAEYDANTTGGAIRITLKKRRENGLDGSLSMRTKQGEFIHRYMPAANINIHSGRTDFYASAWAGIENQKQTSDELTRYTAGNASLTASSFRKERDRTFGASAGAVVEIAPRHSVGAEFEFWRDNEPGWTNTRSDFSTEGTSTLSDSRYDTKTGRRNYSGTFNYIWKIDSLGSTLKLLADYTRREIDGSNDNISRITVSGKPATDSLYRDNSMSRYDVATATLALAKNFSPRWSLSAGAKYTRNDMRNSALYEYVKDQVWVENTAQNVSVNYTENIVAAYATASMKSGRWSLVAGLRGEYTSTDGKNVGQDYFSLFPNANLSYALSRDGAYSLTAQYGRTIERPSFWRLTPQRQQVSDYTYQVGNPELDPSYKQDISMTLVMKHKYSLTAGVTLQSGEINQVVVPDGENPDLLAARWVNYDRTKNYYLAVNLPFQPAKWWMFNVNATYMLRGQRMDAHAKEEFFNFAFVNLSTTFTLPAKFYIDLSYDYQSRLDIGNLWVEPTHRLQAGIKKRFGERFTASFSANNLLDQRHRVGVNGDGFVRRLKMAQNWNNRAFQIGLTYNFKSGKAFKAKSVEAGSAAEKSRL